MSLSRNYTGARENDFTAPGYMRPHLHLTEERRGAGDGRQPGDDRAGPRAELHGASLRAPASVHAAAQVGFGRIVALYYCSSALYQIH